MANPMVCWLGEYFPINMVETIKLSKKTWQTSVDVENPLVPKQHEQPLVFVKIFFYWQAT